jgi:tetratricopeptide (TPR) repeat protein
MEQWIRRKVTPQIMEAIHASDRSTHVFYITSKGGTGKTVLLRQIGVQLGSEDGIQPHFPWSGILDLYHAAVNSSSGLERHISNVLEAESKEFQCFRDERAAYAERRSAGLIGRELEDERVQMARVFTECVNVVTRWGRAVIALDTTERIQHEVDEVQRLCDLQDESTTVRAWLLDQLRRWHNCVVLLVGRPEGPETPNLGAALAQALADVPAIQYHALELGGFDLTECRQYLALKRAQYQPDLEELGEGYCERLYEVTEGRPILLELAVEVIRHSLGFDDLWQEMQGGDLKKIRAKIERLLIDLVMGGEANHPLQDVLRYLATSRKGLNSSLLQHLAGGWDLETCQAKLQQVRRFSFVKQHAEDERLFLHDEMYLMCDRYLLRPEEVQELSARIVEWYDRQIAAETDADKRQSLEVDSLFYRLRANPEEGYHWYVKQTEFAIRGVQVGFDMRLHNEAMSFFKSQSPADKRILENTPGLAQELNCDSVARWVKRLLVRGELEQAVGVAVRVIGMPEGLCAPNGPWFALARADVRVHQAQAMIYLGGRDGKAVSLLKNAIAELEGQRHPEVLALEDADAYAGWRRNLVLGRAHNNLGYIYWMHLGQYRAALDAFRAALPYFRQPGLQEELANTSDNMGRVAALLRHPTRAESLVDTALQLRHELGREYGMALSLTSRAIVHLEFGEFNLALRTSQQALNVFEGLGTGRGVGLALITAGRAERGLGAQWRVSRFSYSYEECEDHLRAAATYLDRAVRIFEGEIREPVRLAEACNELGCIFRERMRLAIERNPSSALIRTTALEAVRWLRRSCELAQEHGFAIWLVDSCEDLARVYLYQHDYDNAQLWLERAEKSIPDEYKLNLGRAPDQIPVEESVEAFWRNMGKIELTRGNLGWLQATQAGELPTTRIVREKAVEHYLLAATYFEHYSDRDPGIRSTLGYVYNRCKDCSLEELRYLRNDWLPEVARRYFIDARRLRAFFEDTMGLEPR